MKTAAETMADIEAVNGATRPELREPIIRLIETVISTRKIQPENKGEQLELYKR